MRVGVLFVALIISQCLIAQDQRCGTKAPSTGEFENWMEIKLKNKLLRTRPKASAPPVYQIPIVIHLFHKGEPIGTGTNLSLERILAQIDTLNADFRRLNEDAVNTPTDFQSVAADTEIEFVLARQDPAGNPTNGIVRIHGEQSTYRVNSDKVQLRTESFWPPEKYMNIYVADLRTFIGYASFPVTSLDGITNENDDFILDAVYVDFEYFGNNPSAPAFESRGRTLAHEIGHFLGLRHIWGDTNCSGDDFVADTPTARFDHSGTTSPCTYPIPDDASTTAFDDGNTCTEEDDPDLPDMFQNYMDYTDDICMNLFTLGQKDRMRIVLENSPRRNSLLSSPALNEPTRFVDDLAVAQIISPEFAECDNQITPALEVVNHGTNDITSYDIQLVIDGLPIGSPTTINTTLLPFESDTIYFPNQIIGATPSSVAFSIVGVNGNTDGNASNNTSTKDLSYLNSINLPYSEDFESGNTLLGRISSSSIWEVSAAPKEVASNQAVKFKSFQNQEGFGETTILETPPLDLNGVPSATLSFSYAYADITGGFHDGLVVKASTDCGETYPDVIFSATGAKLATAPSTASEFTPANQLQWLDTILGISAYRNFDQVKFQFIGLNGGGNNLYIDNITIEETNVLENDINLQSISSPLVTCDEGTFINLEIRNAGSQPITSFSIEYDLNENTFSQTFNGINVGEREYENFPINVAPLAQNTNDITVRVVEVNNSTDQSEFGNTVSASINRNLDADEYPLHLTFDSSDNWLNLTPNENSLWERTTLSDNGVLRANSFDEAMLGTESWFISPALTSGGLDSAGLSFKVSYASREGLNDQLRVLASVNCGESYSMTLLEADADSLSVAESTSKWIPSSDADWKEFNLDLSGTIPFKDEIRIAFVFINGNGNDLYIDDIAVTANDPPVYQEVFRVFPNPVSAGTYEFNLGFNLPIKEPVNVEMMDMSGRLVIRQTVSNALNQIIPFEAPKHPGLYFIRVSNSNFAETQKLFINP